MNSNLRKLVDLLLITDTIRLTGGVTYNINTQELNPSHGFMVSFENFSEVKQSVTEDDVRDYIGRHASLLAKENCYFGCWFDGLNYVFDVSERYERMTDAAFWALVRKQTAIYDCAKKKEIRIRPDRTLSGRFPHNIFAAVC
jgi:hypothetical protein